METKKRAAMLKWTALVAALGGIGAFAVQSCSSGNEAPIDTSPTSSSNGGSSGGGTCSHPAPGCSCESEGQTAQCGSSVANNGGEAVCSEGTTTCSNGTWSTCVESFHTLANRHPLTLHALGSAPLRPLELSNDSGSCNDPCDPYCQTFNGDNSNGIDGGTGLEDLDGGWTLTDAPVPPDATICVHDQNGRPTNQCFVTCEAGSTTITGKVMDPAGNYPIPNALVMIPNDGYIQSLKDGLNYDPCNGQNLPAVLSVTTSALDGTFSLGTTVSDGGGGVPLESRHIIIDDGGDDGGTWPTVPILIQVGRWRRVVEVALTNPCGANQVQITIPPDLQSTCDAGSPTPGVITLPAVQGGCYQQDNIPHIGLITGACDPFECLLNDIGIDRSQFSPFDGGGRVELVTANNQGGASNPYQSTATNTGGGLPGSFNQPSGGNVNAAVIMLADGGIVSPNNGYDLLLTSQNVMQKYDIIMLPCRCEAEYEGPPRGDYAQNETATDYNDLAGYRENIVEYANSGGRLLTSHWGREWIERIALGFDGGSPGSCNPPDASAGCSQTTPGACNGADECYWNGQCAGGAGCGSGTTANTCTGGGAFGNGCGWTGGCTSTGACTASGHQDQQDCTGLTGCSWSVDAGAAANGCTSTGACTTGAAESSQTACQGVAGGGCTWGGGCNSPTCAIAPTTNATTCDGTAGCSFTGACTATTCPSNPTTSTGCNTSTTGCTIGPVGTNTTECTQTNPCPAGANTSQAACLNTDGQCTYTGSCSLQPCDTNPADNTATACSGTNGAVCTYAGTCTASATCPTNPTQPTDCSTSTTGCTIAPVTGHTTECYQTAQCPVSSGTTANAGVTSAACLGTDQQCDFTGSCAEPACSASTSASTATACSPTNDPAGCAFTGTCTADTTCTLNAGNTACATTSPDCNFTASTCTQTGTCTGTTQAACYGDGTQCEWNFSCTEPTACDKGTGDNSVTTCSAGTGSSTACAFNSLCSNACSVQAGVCTDGVSASDCASTNATCTVASSCTQNPTTTTQAQCYGYDKQCSWTGACSEPTCDGTNTDGTTASCSNGSSPANSCQYVGTCTASTCPSNPTQASDCSATAGCTIGPVTGETTECYQTDPCPSGSNGSVNPSACYGADEQCTYTGTCTAPTCNAAETATAASCGTGCTFTGTCTQSTTCPSGAAWSEQSCGQTSQCTFGGAGGSGNGCNGPATSTCTAEGSEATCTGGCQWSSGGGSSANGCAAPACSAQGSAMACGQVLGCQWGGGCSSTCSAQTNATSCGNVTGCTWDTDSQVCTGPACNGSTQATCQLGGSTCVWNGCTFPGTCPSDTAETITTCQSHTGCVWTGSCAAPVCPTGNAVTETSCQQTAGCTWTGTCSDTGTCATKGDELDCGNVPGCGWVGGANGGNGCAGPTQPTCSGLLTSGGETSCLTAQSNGSCTWSAGANGATSTNGCASANGCGGAATETACQGVGAATTNGGNSVAGPKCTWQAKCTNNTSCTAGTSEHACGLIAGCTFASNGAQQANGCTPITSTCASDGSQSTCPATCNWTGGCNAQTNACSNTSSAAACQGYATAPGNTGSSASNCTYTAGTCTSKGTCGGVSESACLAANGCTWSNPASNGCTLQTTTCANAADQTPGTCPASCVATGTGCSLQPGACTNASSQAACQGTAAPGNPGTGPQTCTFGGAACAYNGHCGTNAAPTANTNVAEAACPGSPAASGGSGCNWSAGSANAGANGCGPVSITCASTTSESACQAAGCEWAVTTPNTTGVFSITIVNAGTGYSSTPTVTFTGGCTTEPTVQSITMNGGGSTRTVAAVNLKTAGSGCTSMPTVKFTGGGAPTVTAAAIAVIGNGCGQTNTCAGETTSTACGSAAAATGNTNTTAPNCTWQAQCNDTASCGGTAPYDSKTACQLIPGCLWSANGGSAANGCLQTGNGTTCTNDTALGEQQCKTDSCFWSAGANGGNGCDGPLAGSGCTAAGAQASQAACQGTAALNTNGGPNCTWGAQCTNPVASQCTTAGSSVTTNTEANCTSINGGIGCTWSGGTNGGNGCGAPTNCSTNSTKTTCNNDTGCQWTGSCSQTTACNGSATATAATCTGAQCQWSGACTQTNACPGNGNTTQGSCQSASAQCQWTGACTDLCATETTQGTCTTPGCTWSGGCNTYCTGIAPALCTNAQTPDCVWSGGGGSTNGPSGVPYGYIPFPNVALWDIDDKAPPYSGSGQYALGYPDPGTALASTNATRESDFSQWIQNTLQGTDQIPWTIDPAKYDVPNLLGSSVRFAYSSSTANVDAAAPIDAGGPNSVIDFTFDTPLGTVDAGDAQTGRVMFTDMHLSEQSQLLNPFHNGCNNPVGGIGTGTCTVTAGACSIDTDCPSWNTPIFNTGSAFGGQHECQVATAGLTMQERVAEYLLFDLGACTAQGLPPAAPPGHYYASETFVRDYCVAPTGDPTGSGCPVQCQAANSSVVWRDFDFVSSIPQSGADAGAGDAGTGPDLVFGFSTAPTEAQLGVAHDAGGPAIIQISPVTISETCPAVPAGTPSSCPVSDVDSLYASAGDPAAAKQTWLRVYMTLNPDSTHQIAPILVNWAQNYDCVPAQ